MATNLTNLGQRTGPFEILPSAARTATPDVQEFQAMGVNYRALYVIVDVTVDPSTASFTVTVAGVDRTSGKTFDVLESATINAVGTTVLQVGPGITAASNVDEDSYLPPIFQVSVAHTDAESITYSVGGILCP